MKTKPAKRKTALRLFSAAFRLGSSEIEINGEKCPASA
jgi:hypothetical protein